MLRSLVHQMISRQERTCGVPLDYLRELSRTSLPAFFKFLLFTPLANHRRHLTPEAFHVARLAATQAEDCGTCLQIVVHFARRDGIEATLLRKALAGDPAALPAPLGEVLIYASKLARGEDAPEQRQTLRAHLGDAALVELALAVATARVFPTLKRGLGHAVACSAVRLEV